MFKVIILFAILAAAFGFIPSATRSNSRGLKMAVGDETMSRSLPFLKKPKNLDGLVVRSCDQNYNQIFNLAISRCPLVWYFIVGKGSEDFDPIGFAEYFDVKWMQEAELKHSRIAMLAVVGWLVQSAGIHLPSPDGLYDVSNPIDAFFHVGPSPIAQVLLSVPSYLFQRGI